MKKLVPLKVSFLSKGFFAHVAGEGLYASMEALMLFQVGLPRETFLTLWTFVWLFTCVRSKVDDQLVRKQEFLVTKAADVALT